MIFSVPISTRAIIIKARILGINTISVFQPNQPGQVVRHRSVAIVRKAGGRPDYSLLQITVISPGPELRAQAGRLLGSGEWVTVMPSF